MLNMADMPTGSILSIWLRQLRPAEIQKSGCQVCETGFTKGELDNLYGIVPRLSVPKDHENDIRTAVLRGKQTKKAYIQEI